MKSLLIVLALTLVANANAEETMREKPRHTFACVKLNNAPVAIFATLKEAQEFVAANTTNGHANGSLPGTKFEIDQNQENTVCAEAWERMEMARIDKELYNKGHK